MKSGSTFKTEAEAQRIGWLVAGFIQQRLNEAERDELDAWITASDDHQRLFEELLSPGFIEEGTAAYRSVDAEAAYHQLKQRIQQSSAPKTVRIRRMQLISIAASIVFVVCVLVFYQMTYRKTKPLMPVAVTEGITPGGNYAELITDNGKRVTLAGLKNGLIDSLDGVEVLKTTDGQLSYLDNQHSATVYHTLRTPVGGQYRLVLPDGSLVWLNAGSSLRFPVRFDGPERRVELIGEGYFEIVPAAKLLAEGKQASLQPFIVRINNVEVEVLGTHFNVHGYADEAAIKTTLLEGKVKVVRGSEQDEVILQPGEQAVAGKGRLRVERVQSTEAIVAWKNGWFDFKNASIEQIMQQAKRWYNIDSVVYTAAIEKKFDAEVLRSESIEKLLSLLEQTGGVHFTIKNKTIYVLP
ncbi:FecR family protein [Lacibacter cauensis]|uniref:FecR family protein n=1 Tax=Lacibacter cauensis TaxID=510947 RepID=A0A562SQ38_9BACT|nr:FecR family protein [Lacibacter cauensis]TWI83253.1 FecR family protein [Lacibacter cauensis]